MNIYKTKAKRFPGTHWWQVSKSGQSLYAQITKNTKRRPYIRSAYFEKEKIFLELFWRHLHQKTNIRDKTRRLKYLPCAIELIEKSRFSPSVKLNPNNKQETVYRFTGITAEKEIFYVQIKSDRKGAKWLMSIFPSK